MPSLRQALLINNHYNLFLLGSDSISQFLFTCTVGQTRSSLLSWKPRKTTHLFYRLSPRCRREMKKSGSLERNMCLSVAWAPADSQHWMSDPLREDLLTAVHNVDLCLGSPSEMPSLTIKQALIKCPSDESGQLKRGENKEELHSFLLVRKGFMARW